MSKYAKKVEKQLSETRRQEQIQAEKKQIERIIGKMRKAEKKAQKKEDEVQAARKKLQEEYLKSLKVGDIRTIELAKQSILTYEIDRKLQQETKGEITL